MVTLLLYSVPSMENSCCFVAEEFDTLSTFLYKNVLNIGWSLFEVKILIFKNVSIICIFE